MRESGILMHVTSLPGPYGIGTMGRQAHDFVDFLERAGQSYWQILPLTPTGYGDSPYQSFSSRAGNPYLIDLDCLIREGLLTQEEVDAVCWGIDPGRVDFGAMYDHRLKVLELAWKRFLPGGDYTGFLAEHSHWLEEHSLFMALKERYSGTWLDWPRGLMLHEADALDRAREELAPRIEFHNFLQFQFFRQWKELRGYANQKGIRIIGDVPIYVPLDSVDVWANPKLFLLDENRRPTEVAGCPPDGFSAEGQLWGNPLYNWSRMAEDGYSWWLGRLKAAADLYDVVRIDHFRGFESFWTVPAGDADARNGAWVKGPGMDFIRVVQAEFPALEFIAEDLGFVTPEVRQLQLESGYPGMKVIEFAFDSREAGDYLPHLYPVDSVCYTGTHDNVTLKQWLDEADPSDLLSAKTYLGLNHEETYLWGMIRAGMSSVSRLFVAQMQDYLELGGEARMNEPGVLSMSNWTWRAREGFAADPLAKRILDMTCRYGRQNQT